VLSGCFTCTMSWPQQISILATTNIYFVWLNMTKNTKTGDGFHFLNVRISSEMSCSGVLKTFWPPPWRMKTASKAINVSWNKLGSRHSSEFLPTKGVDRCNLTCVLSLQFDSPTTRKGQQSPFHPFLFTPTAHFWVPFALQHSLVIRAEIDVQLWVRPEESIFETTKSHGVRRLQMSTALKINMEHHGTQSWRFGSDHFPF